MPEPRPILILGGTGEALRLAAALAQIPGLHTITSLAGRTSRPPPIAGALRVGGFGGPEGLARYLRDSRVAAVIDATHPYAQRISENAMAASAATDVPLLRFTRPAWEEQPGDRWLQVTDAPAAAHVLPSLAKRVLLTTGHKEIEAFAGLDGIWFLVRLIETPADPLPLTRHEVLLARGPFEEHEERALFQDRRIGALVTKNSGGTATYAKLAAARRLALPVVMIDRPPALPGLTAASVVEAVAWTREIFA
jgi:precorrin-6A/cobalt-precorrin-6A reductase